ncbi:hypothetical protein [Paenibacillus sp. JJ-100]|uniref:hypothetical protein n=1 Tax=Paenibacillus sp. JJ-100 TaxID=2974896 RepID=UPI00232C7F42|nr:hypothetical protein [Paenibacillus sp. JJ-100]
MSERAHPQWYGHRVRAVTHSGLVGRRMRWLTCADEVGGRSHPPTYEQGWRNEPRELGFLLPK